MLLGRLGLETARQPHADRHGCLYLDRGRLEVEDGCIRFATAGGALESGEWQIPHQSLSIILLGPGSSVTHDALRILARHGVALAAVGSDGVRFYTAPPLLPDQSAYARRQAELWGRPQSRIAVARRMYGLRLGKVLPHRDIAVLRGIEGARVKESYRLTAARFGVPWHGRRYDRANPAGADIANQAINHAASAVEAAAAVAVAATATIPQLGFIHEDSGQSFVLDIADLAREQATLPIAFGAAKEALRTGENVERLVRRKAGRLFSDTGVIPLLIDRIKTVLQIEEGHPQQNDASERGGKSTLGEARSRTHRAAGQRADHDASAAAGSATQSARGEALAGGGAQPEGWGTAQRVAATPAAGGEVDQTGLVGSSYASASARAELPGKTLGEFGSDPAQARFSQAGLVRSSLPDDPAAGAAQPESLRAGDRFAGPGSADARLDTTSHAGDELAANEVAERARERIAAAEPDRQAAVPWASQAGSDAPRQDVPGPVSLDEGRSS